MAKIFLITSPPRSGSSLLANLISGGKNILFSYDGSKKIQKSEFNKEGYFEDTKINLMNDMLIKSLYGNNYNFLYPPRNIKTKIKSFNYYSSINSKIFYPKNFLGNIKKYTNHSWDNWGISRMEPGEKWFECYKTYGVDTDKKLKKIIRNLKEITSKSKKNLIFKDARMIFTYHKLDFKNTNLIILKRRCKKKHIDSIRNHYGPNLFKRTYIDKNKTIVSNHFNYQVKYLSYREYLRRYNIFFAKIKKKYNYLEIFYEDLLEKNLYKISSLENFIEKKINLKKIKIQKN